MNANLRNVLCLVRGVTAVSEVVMAREVSNRAAYMRQRIETQNLPSQINSSSFLYPSSIARSIVPSILLEPDVTLNLHCVVV